MPDLDLLGDKG